MNVMDMVNQFECDISNQEIDFLEKYYKAQVAHEKFMINWKEENGVTPWSTSLTRQRSRLN